MRLLCTTTLKLVTVPSWDPPPYAILSHTWGQSEDEVSFEDMTSGLNVAKTRASFPKLESACRLALAHGHRYCWIDTCCINQSSSAELQEAINSMFKWYQDAQVCFAYLSDVENVRAEFRHARWFTRGWTLQELLAPTDLIFYARNWQPIGTKKDLAFQIRKITGIEPAILLGERPIERESVAERMLWASSRKTSRPEDQAYCLMGIFGVNMPMIYGEGERAFRRLQEEIMKTTNDESIFAWRDASYRDIQTHGLLADRPSQFADSGGLTNLRSGSKSYSRSEPHSLTSMGMRIEARLCILRHPRIGGDMVYAMPLSSSGVIWPLGPDVPVGYLCLILYYDNRSGFFTRINVGQFVLIKHMPPSRRTIYVCETWSHRRIDENFVLAAGPGTCRHKFHAKTGVVNVVPQPIFISDERNSARWTAIGWTVSWRQSWGRKAHPMCLCLEDDRGELLTVKIRVAAAKGSDTRDIFFQALDGDHYGANTGADYSKVRTMELGTVFLKKYNVRMVCAASGETRKREESGVLVFQVWDRESEKNWCTGLPSESSISRAG